VVLAIVAGLAVLCCGGGAIVTAVLNPDTIAGLASPAPSPSPSDDPLKPLVKGDCVVPGRTPAEGAYRRTSCKDKAVSGTVTAAIEGIDRAQECTPDTDFVFVRAGWTACLHSNGTDHLGVAGRGGGAIIAGDCVKIGGMTAAAQPSFVETVCGVGSDYEKVVARVDTEAQCTDPAIQFTTLRAAPPHPILCLENGPGNAVAGECVDQNEAGLYNPVPVDCSSSEADMTVLDRKPSKSACRLVRGTTHVLDDPQALPRFKVLCAKQKNGQSS
jgi:hypothetical protein